MSENNKKQRLLKRKILAPTISAGLILTGNIISQLNFKINTSDALDTISQYESIINKKNERMNKTNTENSLETTDDILKDAFPDDYDSIPLWDDSDTVSPASSISVSPQPYDVEETQTNNQFRLTVNGAGLDYNNSYSYQFDPKETLTELKNAIIVYSKYSKYKNANNSIKFATRALTPDETKEYLKALQTIFNLNMEFIEIENRLIKEELAQAYQTQASAVDIKYELNTRTNEGRINITVNGKKISEQLSGDLSNRITTYKKHIIYTQYKDSSELSLSDLEKIDYKILKSIANDDNITFFATHDIVKKDKLFSKNDVLKIVRTEDSTKDFDSSLNEDER